MTSEAGDLKEAGRGTYKLAMVSPTPFYYQVPLFKEMTNHPKFELQVYFCSDESIKALDVAKRYNSSSHWGLDDDLLKGYKHKFLRNYLPFGSYMKPLVGLFNPSVWSEVRRSKPDVVVLMSWMNPTWWLAVATCKILRIPFFYLTDQNIQRESVHSPWKKGLKSLILGKLLFRWAEGFLCAGTANRQLYKYYGVPDEKLIPFAFSWGYESLLQSSEQINAQRSRLRAELGIPEDGYVILYCGRLSSEKGLMGLLDAYKKVDIPGKALAFVGDGPLMQTLRDHTVDHNIESVHFFGFQNRKEISKFYAIADVLVLPSDQETWGMVVSESLCFSLPVVTSEQVGASLDLVQDGYNGFTFPAGDVEALTERLQRLADLPETTRKKMGENSRRLMEEWSKRDLFKPLEQYLDRILPGNRKSAGPESS